MPTRWILLFLCAVIAGALYILSGGSPNRPALNVAHQGPAVSEESPEQKSSASQDAVEPLKNATLGDAQPAWEKAVVDVITGISNDSDHPAACRALLKMVKTAPPSTQGVLAKHIVNLADGNTYKEAFALMDDQTLSPKFHKVIAAELLNQSDEIKLPGLLKLASSPWHPFRGKALPILATLTGEDAGEDWQKWANIVENKLSPKPAPTEPSGEAPASAN